MINQAWLLNFAYNNIDHGAITTYYGDVRGVLAEAKNYVFFNNRERTVAIYNDNGTQVALVTKNGVKT